MKMGIVILMVRDIARSKKFYTEVIGLKVEESQSNEQFVALITEGPLLALQDVSSATAPQQTKQAGSVEVGFNMNGVDDTFRRWKNAGVEVVKEPEDRPFGRYFLVKDPDGHYLDVYGQA